ncbi:nuclear envelope integral membrane protein 1-like isoform X1 [Liolophura sinensis]|uniref:nuclear envelope integral membrane protein 1-like isoform X1 n=1 Tax=Liolophura sinensis TaxID=3198878 RepID=UPI003159892C
MMGFVSVSCFISGAGNTGMENTFKSTTATTTATTTSLTKLHESPRDAQFTDCVNGPKYTCVILRQGLAVSEIFTPERGEVHVYCYRGEIKKPWKLWKKPQVKVNFGLEASYKVYWGKNASDIYSQYSTDYMAHLTMIYRPETLTLDPFNASCIGVSSTYGYHLQFSVKSIELWYPFLQFLGIFFFFYAKKLSKNAAFHYGTGVSVGVVASILIVAYILGKYIPRRAGFITFFLGGWSIMAYEMYYIWYQLRSIMEDYYQFVVGYLLVVGLISFGFCYKYGPVSDARSLNLIQWAIQLLGLILIYFMCQIPEISAAVIVILICIYNFPRSILNLGRRFRFRFFPPQRRLLTEEEFIRQGDEETRKALEDLRQFCRSPECNAWKTIGNLKTPKRFASFIEGDSHLTDQELIDYDSDPEPVLPQDDDDDEDDSNDEENHRPNLGYNRHRWRPPNSFR